MKCSLGEERINRQGQFVFGQGVTNSIMLIGEGPGKDEEIAGQPFVGKSGKLLRKVLKLIGMDEFYVSNLVACRSCSQQVDAAGLPMFRTNWQTKQPELVFKDEPPLPVQYNACLPRLYEEIYLVDPVIIVGLGSSTCQALLGKPITITRDRGETSQIDVPGASFVPSLTEKKEAWARKKGGVIITPIEQNFVRYLFLPTLHPAYVIRKLADKGGDSPLLQLVADLRKALKVYETYREMVYGIVPTHENYTDNDDVIQQHLQDEGDE